MTLRTLIRNPFVTVMLGVETPSGPALGGVIVAAAVPSKKGRTRDPLNAGFRPGQVPNGLHLARYLNGSAVRRGPVWRADAAWIHGRGQDPRFPRLQNSRVVVLGAGSLGASIALALTQAGVGHTDVVDPESLSWPNVGCHPLGADYVAENKAKGLVQKLRRDFPHVTARAYDIDADTMMRKHADVLSSCDLIIATTGSWAADRRLEAWREASCAAVPVLYGWTEASCLAQ